MAIKVHGKTVQEAINIQTFVDKMIATFPQGSRWKIYQGANSLSSGSISLTKIGDRLV